MVNSTPASTVAQGDRLWSPSAERIALANLTRYAEWLARERGLRFADYDALWRWSVDDLDAFWQSIWDYFEIRASELPHCVLERREMPGASWFPGARLNYAEHALRHERPGQTAVLYTSERTELRSLGWEELGGQVRIVAERFRSLGIQPGDRVAAYVPNVPEALVAMLACAAIGAVWASCGPDFGVQGVLERYRQLEPRVFICVDGYQYGGRAYDRRDESALIAAGLPTLDLIVQLPYLDRTDRRPVVPGALFWEELLAGLAVPAAGFRYEQVPFDHPLWILFSSGTTGLPKAIVHGHGGIVVEHLKHLVLHFDVHPGQRLFFFTTTGWMMWNFLMSSLLCDVVPVMYDGNPAWPEPDVLWRMVEAAGVTHFGAGPSYVAGQVRAGIVPRERFDLGTLESITLAGSPVTPECMQWCYDNVKRDLWVASGSGGTDVCSGFVGGVVTRPVYAGEIQARLLGCHAQALDAEGHAVIDEVGELVITQPMPSMPVRFWRDEGNDRYLESYFRDYPGVWRHGDFFRLNARGGSFVLGRSDATLNRHGVRIGTAEIYRSLEGLDAVEDALIVNLDLPGGRFFMPLFVRLRAGAELDEGLLAEIRRKLARDYSPRHVPDEIVRVTAIPYTLTGKKMEVPVRKLLMGVPIERAANRHAMADSSALDDFIGYARERTARQV